MKVKIVEKNLKIWLKIGKGEIHEIKYSGKA